MKRIICLLTVLMLGCTMPPTGEAPPVSSSPGGPTTQVRVVSWNVRNLFDTKNDKYKDDVPSKKEYREKLTELATVIETVDADFLALQEVENIKALKALNKTLRKPYPVIGLLEGNDQIRGIDVAFMSRLPVKRVVSHRRHDLPDLHGISKHHPFSRDCLEVAVDTEPPVIFLVNHLKSQKGKKGDKKGLKKSATKRRAQSEGVVEIAQELMAQEPRAAVVALGDMNDRPDSWAVEPLFKEFSDPFTKLSRSDRVTHRFRGGGSAIDHILLSDRAVPLAGSPQVWQNVARATSDHSPISLEFQLRVLSQAQTKTWTR